MSSRKQLFESPGRLSLAARFAIGLVLVLGALSGGCASAPLTPVTQGIAEPLGGDEGFLIVHIDTAVTVNKILAGRLQVARDLPAGDHIWIIRAKADRYRWDGIRLAAQLAGTATIRPVAKGVFNEEEFEFDLEAGKINYPGHLLIELDSAIASTGGGLSIRNRNHSAMAIRKLMKSHSKLLAAHPIRYAGSSNDEFLDFYTRERDRRATSSSRAGTEAVK